MSSATHPPRLPPCTGRRVRLARWVMFSAAHLYRQKAFSDAENLARFGRCFTPHGHGHNYVLEAQLEGPIDAGTGLVVNLIDVDRVLKSVADPLDHKHLNFDVPEFHDAIPTTEMIAKYCFARVREKLQPYPLLQLVKVRLYETDDLWVEYGDAPE